jgi:proline racemase
VRDKFSAMLDSAGRWRPPTDWPLITTIDAHTEGEPLRIIIGGLPEIRGETILERRRFARQNLDRLRTALMWEPRGHADMYGCIITSPVTAEAHFGVLFLHNEGFSTMCGHGIIAVAKVAVETGMVVPVEPETTVVIDTPAGLVTAHARIAGGNVSSVYFHNVPSFVLALDDVVEVPGLGRIKYDLAFGGAFYAFVQAEQVGLELAPANFRQLIEKGTAIKHAIMDKGPMEHPFEPDLNFLYGTVFIGPPVSIDADSRNVCIFAEGEVDRSPTGTGVSARLALHYARGEIDINQAMVVESIIGSTFSGRVIKQTNFGPHQAIIPEIEGRAYITGRHEFIIEPGDSRQDGFILR